MQKIVFTLAVLGLLTTAGAPSAQTAPSDEDVVALATENCNRAVRRFSANPRLTRVDMEPGEPGQVRYRAMGGRTYICFANSAGKAVNVIRKDNFR